MTYGVTPSGFVAKTVEIIEQDLDDAFHANVDAALDLSPDQPMGQIKSIFARQIAKLWELGATAYNAFNPNAVEGFLQDALYQLSGSKRQAARASTVALSMTLGSSATVPAGSTANVIGQSTNRWTLIGPATGPGATGKLIAPGPVVSTTAGTYYGFFQADTTGPRSAAAGTITTITAPVSGWTAVTNAADATLGADQETDAAFRLRREAELAAPGSGAVDAIRADLREVTGVIEAFVFENTTDTTDANGLPPHAIECVIYDGAVPAASNDDIAAVIWKDKPSGIQLHGSTSDTIIDATGATQTIYFSRPTLKRVYITIPSLTTDPLLYDATNGPAAVKLAIATYWASVQDLGAGVIALALKAAALTVRGVKDVPVLQLDFAPSPTNTANLAIAGRELATISTTDITV